MEYLSGIEEYIIRSIMNNSRSVAFIKNTVTVGVKSGNKVQYIRTAAELCNAEDRFKQLGPRCRRRVADTVFDRISDVYGLTNPCKEIPAPRKLHVDIDEADQVFKQLPKNKPSIEDYMPRTTVKTTHYVNGMDVEIMSKDDLVSAVKNVEQEIKELEAVEADSKAITGMVEELKKSLAFIVSHLDSKE